MARRDSNLIPALLKHWRTRRGLSQLDLALAAEVSARHLSFLETGRAQPSREMILRLAAVLGVPLRDQNTALGAAGFADGFPEPALAEPFSPAVHMAIERMLAQHEPFPMLVANPRYDIVRTNAGAQKLIARMLAEPSALTPPGNMMRALFDPRLMRPFIVDWPRVARAMLMRLHRECLERAGDTALASLLSSLLEQPGIPKDWRAPDLSEPSEPCLTFQLRRDALELGFLTTVTVFNAPQSVTLEELRIESFFPLDEATRRKCEEM